MFHYYGRKKKIAKLYPEPKHGRIVEPFAGSAAYSLHGDRWKNDVTLVEKDEGVYQIWDWLVNKATIDDVKDLCSIARGDKTSDLIKILSSASKRAFTYKTITVTKFMEANWAVTMRLLQSDLHKIKHWKVLNGDYSIVDNEVSTWFIDPPYIGDAGMGYRYGSNLIDYHKLSEWCKSRNGDVIVCEGGSADWLPFEPLTSLIGVSGKVSQEMIYYQEKSV